MCDTYRQPIEFFLQDPNMYEHAVLRRERSQDFGAVVDLWSLGVTIFHTATGHLPFQPYGGRKNTETM